MVTVRLLTASDIPQIIHLGGEMHRESNFSCLDYEPMKVVEKCHLVLHNPLSYFCMVAEYDGRIIGILGAVIGEYEFGHDLISDDIIVYVAPEHRGSTAFLRLIRGYVVWAREHGAVMVFLSQSTGYKVDQIADMYDRLGFERIGGKFCLRGE